MHPFALGGVLQPERMLDPAGVLPVVACVIGVAGVGLLFGIIPIDGSCVEIFILCAVLLFECRPIFALCVAPILYRDFLCEPTHKVIAFPRGDGELGQRAVFRQGYGKCSVPVVGNEGDVVGRGCRRRQFAVCGQPHGEGETAQRKNRRTADPENSLTHF